MKTVDRKTEFEPYSGAKHCFCSIFIFSIATMSSNRIFSFYKIVSFMQVQCILFSRRYRWNCGSDAFHLLKAFRFVFEPQVIRAVSVRVREFMPWQE